MAHKDWFDRGFEDIIPIVPPNVKVGPTLRGKPLGKIPGKKNNEYWVGLSDWLTIRPEPDKWDSWGASVGLRTAYYPAIDIDCTDETLAAELAHKVQAFLGPAPIRIGQAPKRLLLYRTTEPFKRMRIHFGGHYLVEALGAGNQCVVEGLHPSGVSYTWDKIPTAAELTTIRGQDVQRCLDELSEYLEACGFKVTREGSLRAPSTDAPPQDQLRGALEDVKRIVSSLPNTNDLFPGRDDYLKMGYAIKAALPDHEQEAFEIWWEWCARWEGKDGVEPNTREKALSDWRRLLPPYRIGYSWLEDLYQHVFPDQSFPPVTEEAQESAGALRVSEVWIAEQLAHRLSKRLKYCEELTGWFIWSGKHWAKDTSGTVPYIISREIFALANGLIGEERAVVRAKGSRVNVINNVVKMISVNPVIARSVDQLVDEPDKIYTPAGKLDLTTGELSAPVPNEWFVQLTTIGPQRSTPSKWIKFLTEATLGDSAMMEFLQRWAGYMLTGFMNEQKFLLVWGPGGNGKSVFVETLAYIMGDYAIHASPPTFAEGSTNRHPTEFASLRGRRCVIAQETNVGQRWDEARIKSWTSGDVQRARLLYTNEFSFRPTGKLVFVGNHLPKLQAVDDALKRRMLIVPFTFRPKSPNPKLMDELRAESGAILWWMVEGCLKWQVSGLQIPSRVRAQTDEFFSSEDYIGTWLLERALVDSDATTAASQAWSDWVAWCDQESLPPGSQTAFVRALEEKGFRRKRTNAGKVWVGFGLTPEFDAT